MSVKIYQRLNILVLVFFIINFSVCMSICLFICFVSVNICLRMMYACIYVCLWVCLSVCPSVCLYVFLFLSISVCSPVCTCVSAILAVCMSNRHVGAKYIPTARITNIQNRDKGRQMDSDKILAYKPTDKHHGHKQADTSIHTDRLRDRYTHKQTNISTNKQASTQTDISIGCLPGR